MVVIMIIVHPTVYIKFNISTYFKILNNVKSYTPLNVLILNTDHKIDSIHFIWNREDSILVVEFVRVFF
jgi:hypothetical protein